MEHWKIIIANRLDFFCNSECSFLLLHSTDHIHIFHSILVISTILPAPTTPPPGQCPQNWIQNGSVCYNFQPNREMTWFQAEEYCQVSLITDHVRHTKEGKVFTTAYRSVRWGSLSIDAQGQAERKPHLSSGKDHVERSPTQEGPSQERPGGKDFSQRRPPSTQW